MQRKADAKQASGTFYPEVNSIADEKQGKAGGWGENRLGGEVFGPDSLQSQLKPTARSYHSSEAASRGRGGESLCQGTQRANLVGEEEDAQTHAEKFQRRRRQTQKAPRHARHPQRRGLTRTNSALLEEPSSAARRETLARRQDFLGASLASPSDTRPRGPSGRSGRVIVDRGIPESLQSAVPGWPPRIARSRVLSSYLLEGKGTCYYLAK
ncbi:hypothetical protein JRQ81_016054 [Phrynocephalus forsythii]|uniref:Uncharacterized protein n=1 Tax=Phrynocephalus forsythii TaxID=171643 RepID=A0A9Q0XW07_9SAUR|nr:hypothetical protein JRQ81_016054 [Phrynocephalus forsythii]